MVDVRQRKNDQSVQMCFDAICEFSTRMKAVEGKVDEQEDTLDDVANQLITVQEKADEPEEVMILRERVDEQDKTIERQGKAIQTLEMQVTRALDVIRETNDRLKRTVELLSTFPGKYHFQFYCRILNFFNQPDHQRRPFQG